MNINTCIRTVYKYIVYKYIYKVHTETAAYIYIVYTVYIPIQITELTENCNFYLFAAYRKQKWQTSMRWLQTEMENESLFSLVSN